MRVGVLTGGGDCPGLNAVIRAVVRRGAEHGFDTLGYLDGWRGPLEGLSRPLATADVDGLVAVGGTVLGTSRTNPRATDDGLARIARRLADDGVDALVAIGGEDTLGVATALAAEGTRVVGVPKTIDNDLSGTDVTFGFDTAVSIATEAVDRLRTTAASHHRVLVVEVMGRHAGWIALRTGIASGAHVTLVPEQPFDLDDVCGLLRRRVDADGFALVVASEGAVPAGGGDLAVAGQGTDAFGHVRLGGLGERLATELERRLGVETRTVVLGHLQRGGTPTAYDRWLATRLGLHAADAVAAGETGVMTALRGTDVVRVPLAEATGELKVVSEAEYAEVRALSG